jgi:hypothetical protein
LCVAKIDEKDGLTCHGTDINGAGEWHRDAWLGGKTVQRVDDIDVGAIARTYCTVGLWQLDATQADVRPVTNGETVTRERAGRRIGKLEAHADTFGEYSNRNQGECDSPCERASVDSKHLRSFHVPDRGNQPGEPVL